MEKIIFEKTNPRWKIGDKNFYLTIQAGPLRDGKRIVFLCRCVCGAERLIPRSKLELYKSCGCKRADLLRANSLRIYPDPEIGKQIRNLTILSSPIFKDVPGTNKKYFKCRCVCGYEFEKRYDVICRQNNSCGCIRRTQQLEAPWTKHGGTKTRLYAIWSGMRQRCYNQNNGAYYLYGGKGVVIGEQWSEFINFRIWAESNGYQPNLVLERKNPDKNYEPDNCEWITKQQNTKNIFIFRHKERQRLLERVHTLEAENILLKKKLEKYAPVSK